MKNVIVPNRHRDLNEFIYAAPIKQTGLTLNQIIDLHR